MTTLILVWSSDEYIGQDHLLRFTTGDVPGVTSMINGTVIGTLTNNTIINGVPVLVSELRIVADRASTVTCISGTTGSSTSRVLNVTGMYIW